MEGRGGGFLGPCNTPLVPYGIQKITGCVHTLLSIDKGIDCVLEFVLSCILRKILLLVTRILGACGVKCSLCIYV